MRVSTIPRPISSSPIRANGPTGISPPNSSAIAVRTQGIALAARGERGRVRAVRVGDAADVREVAVDVAVGGRVAGGGEVALDGGSEEIADDHRLRRELVEGDAAGLDDHQLLARHAGREVAARPAHEPVADELRVQLGDLGAEIVARVARRTDAPASGRTAKLVHHRAGAPEMIVQRRVVAVDLVVAIRRAAVGQVAVAAHLSHRRRRVANVVVAAGGDSGVDRRAERRSLVRVDDVQRTPKHVRVDLHQQRVLDQAAGDRELPHGRPAASKVSTIVRAPNAVASISAR